MRPRGIILSVGAALALVAGGTAAGAAIASSPVSSSGVIDGCYTNAEINGSHVFVLQDQGTTCPKGTTPISWNQTGPQGPAGAPGATGATGPQGPAGPAGPAGAISSLDQLNGTPCNDGAGVLSVTYGGSASVTIACNSPATPKTVASPDNTGSTAIDEGSVTCGSAAITAEGDNIGGSNAWYSVTFDSQSGACNLDLALRIPKDDTDTFDVYQNSPDPSDEIASSETSYTVTGGSGTYFVDVSGGTTGAIFVLSFTPSS